MQKQDRNCLRVCTECAVPLTCKNPGQPREVGKLKCWKWKTLFSPSSWKVGCEFFSYLLFISLLILAKDTNKEKYQWQIQKPNVSSRLPPQINLSANLKHHLLVGLCSSWLLQHGEVIPEKPSWDISFLSSSIDSALPWCEGVPMKTDLPSSPFRARGFSSWTPPADLQVLDDGLLPAPAEAGRNLKFRITESLRLGKKL